MSPVLDILCSYEWGEVEKILDEIRDFATADADALCAPDGEALFLRGESPRVVGGAVPGVVAYPVAATDAPTAIGSVEVLEAEAEGEYYAVVHPGMYFVLLGARAEATDAFRSELRRRVNLLALAFDDLMRAFERQRGGGGGERGGTSFGGNSAPTYTTDRDWDALSVREVGS